MSNKTPQQIIAEMKAAELAATAELPKDVITSDAATKTEQPADRKSVV